MRYKTKDSIAGFFVEDLPGGGIRVECQSCGTWVDSHEKWNEPLICTGCQKELHYPEGAEW